MNKSTNRGADTYTHRAIHKDKNISFKAVGIMTYLETLPTLEGFTMRSLINKHTDGVNSIRSGFNELIEHGYVIKKEVRRENGEYEGWEYQLNKQKRQ